MSFAKIKDLAWFAAKVWLAVNVVRIVGVYLASNTATSTIGAFLIAPERLLWNRE